MARARSKGSRELVHSTACTCYIPTVVVLHAVCIPMMRNNTSKKKFLSKILSIIDLTWLLSTSSWIISMVKIIQDMISISFATTISPSTRHRVCFSRCCYGSMFAWTTTKRSSAMAFLFFALTSTSAAMVLHSLHYIQCWPAVDDPRLYWCCLVYIMPQTSTGSVRPSIPSFAWPR